ncbi:Cobyrinate a,c-diamide synthase [anaerobic digester metagenome]
MPKAILIAGTSSGCGKTSVALGLMKAFARKGLVVQGFKSGPDFIDPGLHRMATALPSHNLDGWMLPTEEIRRIFRRNHEGCDISIIEGAMGLFDGIGAVSEEGSAAQLAKILDVPVLLVVNARGMARSAAALVKGFAEFDPALTLDAVLFNMTGSPVHGQILSQALEGQGVRVLGSLPRVPGLELPSRHLGLVTAEDLDRREERLNALADWVESALDLDALLAALPECSLPSLNDGGVKMPEVRIGYARDRAFCFYYEENLRMLRQAGAELVPFSPLEDYNLPPALKGLYLGGGYPELHAEKLAANTAMLGKIRDFCASGKPVYAECGGFMYLMKSLRTRDGREHAMAGVFDFSCAMQGRHQALGYREVELASATALGGAGERVRGHEFHYSQLRGEDPSAAEAYRVFDRCGRSDGAGGFLKGNCLGSYVHLHFGSNPAMAERFVGACGA